MLLILRSTRGATPSSTAPTAVARALSSEAARSPAAASPAATAAAPKPVSFLEPKTSQLKRMLTSPKLEYIMEGHNGISAKIVEEAGFKGIWASGLSMSAALGVRDNNEASWTQVLETAEFMAAASRIPILLDGDTGFGNFNNAIRLVEKLEQRGVAGVCIEDKLFPKTNSFIDGEAQLLAPVGEMCGKIRAMKENQRDPDFCVVARGEAFITGLGKDVMLERCRAYAESGADAILVHSKRADEKDVASFMAEWDLPTPVVIVPTKYPEVPVSTFEHLGVSMVIWANHNVRSSVQAMRATSQRIFAEQSLAGVEQDIVPVSEIFRLQDADGLKRNEQKYDSWVPGGRPMTETVPDRLDPREFVDALGARGTDFFVGVPDSLLANACAAIAARVPAERHVIAANEGTAVATAAGYHLATGKTPLVYLQNSGLGNTVNPLLSLTDPQVYSIPMVLLVGWRGEPGKRDEPQHLAQGLRTKEMLRCLGVGCAELPNFGEGMEQALDDAFAYTQEHQSPFCLLVRKETFGKYLGVGDDAAAVPPPPAGLGHPEAGCTRELALSHVCDAFDGDEAFVSTTGFTSRELFELRRARGEAGAGRDFLTVGSMGHCSSIATGVALAQPGRRVVCVDGDGALLMHMGSLTTVGHAARDQGQLGNLTHVVLNNGMHDSVGGHATAVASTSVVDLALSCGYRSAEMVDREDGIKAALARAKEAEGPHLLEIRVNAGTRGNLGRPDSTPLENKEAFMNFLEAGGSS